MNQVRLGKQTAQFVPMGRGQRGATAEIRQGPLQKHRAREQGPDRPRDGLPVRGKRGARILPRDDRGRRWSDVPAADRDEANLTHSPQSRSTQRALTLTGADMEWCFIFDDIWVTKFKEEFHHAPAFSEQDQSGSIRDGPFQTTCVEHVVSPADKVRVGEYFRRVWFNHKVVKLSDGTECWAEDATPELLAPHGLAITDEKTKLDWKIEWRKMTGTQTLEKRTWPGKNFPLIVVVGREVFRGRKGKINSGLVRPAIDPSIINDYMTSRMVDQVALSPLPHFLAYLGQVDDTAETQLNNINSVPWSVVKLKIGLDEKGNPMPPPPGWESPAPNAGESVSGAAQAKDDLQRVLNTYAPFNLARRSRAS